MGASVAFHIVFAEATFLGICLDGRGKISPQANLAAGVIVAAAATQGSRGIR
jgi:cytochrome bd-type quinol oxidase subunit 1